MGGLHLSYLRFYIALNCKMLSSYSFVFCFIIATCFTVFLNVSVYPLALNSVYFIVQICNRHSKGNINLFIFPLILQYILSVCSHIFQVQMSHISNRLYSLFCVVPFPFTHSYCIRCLPCSSLQPANTIQDPDNIIET